MHRALCRHIVTLPDIKEFAFNTEKTGTGCGEQTLRDLYRGQQKEQRACITKSFAPSVLGWIQGTWMDPSVQDPMYSDGSITTGSKILGWIHYYRIQGTWMDPYYSNSSCPTREVELNVSPNSTSLHAGPSIKIQRGTRHLMHLLSHLSPSLHSSRSASRPV